MTHTRRAQRGGRSAARNELGQNALESRFHREALALVPEVFEAVHWNPLRTPKWEPLVYELAGRTTYTPDFVIDLVDDFNGDVLVIDVKGFVEQHSIIKIKVAAHHNAQHRFGLVFWQRGRWVVKRVSPLLGVCRAVTLDSLADLIHHV